MCCLLISSAVAGDIDGPDQIKEYLDIWESDSSIDYFKQDFDKKYDQALSSAPPSKTKNDLFLRQSYDPIDICEINEKRYLSASPVSVTENFYKAQHAHNPATAILMLLAAGTGLLIMLENKKS